jgi:hypothetical protein
MERSDHLELIIVKDYGRLIMLIRVELLQFVWLIILNSFVLEGLTENVEYGK